MCFSDKTELWHAMAEFCCKVWFLHCFHLHHGKLSQGDPPGLPNNSPTEPFYLQPKPWVQATPFQGAEKQ